MQEVMQKSHRLYRPVIVSNDAAIKNHPLMHDAANRRRVLSSSSNSRGTTGYSP